MREGMSPVNKRLNVAACFLLWQFPLICSSCGSQMAASCNVTIHDVCSGLSIGCQISTVVEEFQNVILVTLLSSKASQPSMTSFDVNLYACDVGDCCDWCSSLRQEDKYPAVRVSNGQTATFMSLAPGFYRVFVVLAIDAERLCATSSLIAFTAHNQSNKDKDHSSKPTSKEVIAQFHIETSSAISSFRWPSSLPAAATGLDHDRVWQSEDVGPSAIVLAAAGTVIGTTFLAFLALVCYCRRRPLQSMLLKGNACYWRKLLGPSQSSQGSNAGRKLVTRPTLKTEGTSSPSPFLHGPASDVTLFLVPYESASPHCLNAFDAIALYLQACCACQVIYFRWQVDNIFVEGPEAWTIRHLEKVDCIVFIHLSEKEVAIDAGRNEMPKGIVNDDLGKRICTAVSEWISRNETRLNSVKKLHIALSSKFNTDKDQLGLGNFNERFPWDFRSDDDKALPALQEKVCQHQGCQDNYKIAANSSKLSEATEAAAKCHRTKQHVNKMKRLAAAGERVYNLMDDFSVLLADIHGLPSDPRAFKGRNPPLPLDSEHLSSPEGRQLYRSVLSLGRRIANDDVRMCRSANYRRYCEIGVPAEDVNKNDKIDKTKARKEASAKSVEHGDTGEARSEACDVLTLDYGPQDEDCRISFIAPDDAWSLDDADATSLGEQFRALNADYDNTNAGHKARRWRASHGDYYGP